jgi:hypothetical protein
MQITCSRCKERPAYARGLCSRCYQWKRKSAGLVEPIPGLMTPGEADARRRRIIEQMRAEGYSFEAIAERFGGRGVRSGERDTSDAQDTVDP